MSTADLLTLGITAARAGRRDEARATLLKVLEADDRNETAWLWLSGIFEAPAERRVCLENVLAINPANAHARRGLALLEGADPPPAATVALAPEPPAAPAPTPAATVGLAPEQPPAPPAATAALAPATSDTIELASPAEAEGAPPKRPWWRPRPRPAQPAAEPAAPPASAPPPAAPLPAGAVPRPEATLMLPAEAALAGDAEEPCPYCGATTYVGHSRCPACRKSLMAGGVQSAERSLALKVLVGLYALGALGLLGGGMLQVAGLAALGGELAGEGGGGWLPALIAAVGVLVGTALYAGLTLALWRRKAWAFIIHWVGMVLNIVGTVAFVAAVVLMGGALASMLGELPGEGQGAAAGAAGAVAGVFGLAALCNVGLTVGWLALTVACHGDFFGRRVRLSTAGAAAEGDPYNAGIAYRNRGMWYMAAHQWELAARANPRDVTVRRALGLAYAQLGRYEQARDELSVALAITPGDPQLTGDLELVERRAEKGRLAAKGR